MRRRTALGLGSVLAGSVLFGAGGTVAVLTDTASMSAETGAGSLDLSDASARSGQVQLQLGKTAEIPLRAQIAGSEGVVLQVSVVGKPGSVPCPTAAALTIGVPSGAGLQTTDMCKLGAPVTFLELDDLALDGTADAVDLPLTATTTASTATQVSDISWDGYLRFTLRHGHGGFSDQQDVEVHVVTPPGQGGGTPGNGQGAGQDKKDKKNRSASSAAPVGTPAPQAATEQSADTPASGPAPAEGQVTGTGGEPTTSTDAGSGGTGGVATAPDAHAGEPTTSTGAADTEAAATDPSPASAG